MTKIGGKSLKQRVSGALSSTRALIHYFREAFRYTSYPRKKLTKDELVFILQFLKPVWKLGLASLILAIVITALKLILPLNTKFFIDFIVLKESTESIVNIFYSLHLGAIAPYVELVISSLPFLILFMVTLTVSYTILEFIQRYVLVIFQQVLLMSIQTRLFDHILSFPLSFFKNSQTGYLQSRISSDVSMIDYLFSDTIIYVITSILSIIFTFVILFTINVKLAFISLLVVPPFILINIFYGHRLRSVNYRERESSARVSENIQEALAGVEVIKSYSTEDREVKKVSAKIKDVMEARKISQILTSAASVMIRGTQFVFTVVIMWFGYQEINSGTMTVGDYVAFTTYVVMLSSTISSVLMSYQTLQQVFVSIDRVMEMFRIVPEDQEEKQNKNLIKPERVIGNIRYEKVNFAYEKDRPAVKDVSFIVAPGENITIVGPSGAGKSTIVNLLLKFYKPQSGAIYLDGVDLQKIDRKWLREQIGIVSQDIFLFNDTIENNIKYGRLDATHEDVIAAARKAQIDNDIAKLPAGYDTIIGEKGMKLSVGQRQRVSIARAFLKNTPILILDEPTSSIDPAIESMIREAVRELMKDRTTIIISHRMSFATFAKHIIVIKNGTVLEEGTHDELISKNGLYYQLCSPET